MNRQAADLYRRELVGISHIKEANIDLVATGRALRQMVLAPTFVDRDQARALLEDALRGVDEAMAAARDSMVADRERLLAKEFLQQLEQHKHNVEEAVALVDSSRDYQAKATAYVSGEEFNAVADAAEQALQRMAAGKEESARAMAAAMADAGRAAERLTFALLLGSLMSAAIAAVSIGSALQRTANRRDSAVGDNDDETLPAIGYRSEIGAGDANERADELPHERAVVAPERDAAIVDEKFEPLTVEAVAPLKRASILVVEDGESSGDISAGLQAHADCRVTIAGDGQGAVELLEKDPYDVVLMNTRRMVDGINAALAIRKQPAFDRLPIIALTAGSIHEDRERCVAAGIDGHLAKPIDPDGLFRALMSWIAVEAR
jgi:CheY-like chemotaxis protein